MKKYLRCFNNDGLDGLTVGKRYEIVDVDTCEGDECYVIIDDAKARDHWPIEPDYEGICYLDRFTLEIDEEPRKIDGRKAEITHPGKQYSTYRRFAIKHGYPNAAAESDEDDPRRTPQPGDIVTLLVSGKHEREGEGMLWIVEAANGERHIFNEKGLRILSDVTVLKDESLGGIEREYREVKRKACEGERIKIVNADYAGDPPAYRNGDVLTVLELRLGEGEAVIDRKWNAPADENAFVWSDEYVVFEPTDIIRIDDPDGVNRGYRMVDRKAAVGEHVIVTEQVNDDRFSIGETYRVVYVYGGSTWVEHPEGAHVESGGAFLPKYRVLEPIESAKSAAPTAPLSAQSPLDQAAANISALQANYGALEAKVKALESRVVALENKAAAGPVDDTPPSFAGMPRAKSLQQLRDEIVERAKADVKALERIGDSVAEKLPATNPLYNDFFRVEFVINRDKRTVVALVRPKYGSFFSLSTGVFPVIKGIAKCAPNDVFNAHIGRAIALHKALRLEVPAEYLNVPNPEEPRVGDIVTFNDEDAGMVLYRVDTLAETGANCTVIHDGWYGEIGMRAHGGNFSWSRIVDDTREEVSA